MKTLIYVIVISITLGFWGCKEDPDKPPAGPTICRIGLSIVDKNGENFLTDKLEIKGDYIISPYKLTAACNGKTIDIKEFVYSHKTSVLVLYVDLHDFDYMEMEGYTGTVTYRMQLPTVFDDNRETVIDVKWKVNEKLERQNFAEIQEVYINGTKVDISESKLVTMVVEE